MKESIIYVSIMFISGAILWIWEIQNPFTCIDYKARLIKDFVAALISASFSIILVYLFAPVIQVIASPLIKDSLILTLILSLPLWLKLIAAYLLSDLTYYLVHKAMHRNRYFWLSHRWHHSSQPLWWLVGQNTSFTSQFLFKFVFIWFPLLSIPPEIMIFVALHQSVTLNWVHLNVKRKPWMKIVEWVYNTPSFHGIHHYCPEGKNLCGMFTFFDRLFGTYVDPDTFDYTQEQFGLNAKPVTVRTIVGI